jgi:hypothetical protein
MNFATDEPEGGTSVFRAYRSGANTYLADLMESIPQAITYTRVSRFRQPYLVAGPVVGEGSAREPLLRVISTEKIESNILATVTLPQWFIDRVLYVLELERLLGVKI